MLPQSDATAFDQLEYLVDTEGENLAGPDWLGMLEGIGIGIAADRDFAPGKAKRVVLDAVGRRRVR